MATATSISEQQAEWTQRLDALGQKHGVTIHLVQVIGKRRSYLAGPTNGELPMLLAAQVPVTEDVAVLIYTNGALPESLCSRIAEHLRHMVLG